jgi:hypothetical protein
VGLVSTLVVPSPKLHIHVLMVPVEAAGSNAKPKPPASGVAANSAAGAAPCCTAPFHTPPP